MLFSHCFYCRCVSFSFWWDSHVVVHHVVVSVVEVMPEVELGGLDDPLLLLLAVVLGPATSVTI